MSRYLAWLLWILVGAAIGVLWSLGWVETVKFRHTIENLQAWWGPGTHMVDQVDGWLHGLVAALATGWLAWPLIRLGWAWWPAPTVVAVAALVDELVQAASESGRTASLTDLTWGAIGIAVAVGVLLTRRPTTRPDAGPRQARRRR